MKAKQKLWFMSAVCAATIPVSAAKTLELSIMPQGPNPTALMKERLDVFTKETGIPVKITLLDWGAAWPGVNKMLESGKAPDVMQLGTTWVSYLATKGWLAPLNSHLGEIKPDRFLAASWNTTKIDGNDTVWGVPWFVDVRVMMGNHKILDSLKITDKDLANWSTYRQALRRIRDANLTKEGGVKVFPYGFPGKSDWNIPHNFAPWVWSEGGDFVLKGADGKWRSGLLDKATVIGIKKYISFAQDTLANPEALTLNTAQITQRFDAGEQAFLLGTSEVVMQTRIATDSGGLRDSPIGKAGLKAFPVPAGAAGSVAFVGGSVLGIPRGKANDPDALKLLMFLTRADQLDAYTKKMGQLPPDKNVLQEWQKDSVYKVMVQAAEKGKAYPGIAKWVDFEGMLSTMFGDVWTMLGAGGYYSDEELYKTLTAYDAKIDSALGAKPAPMSLDSFKAVLASVKETAIEPEAKKGGSLPVIPIAIVAVVVVGGIGFALSRKKSA